MSVEWKWLQRQDVREAGRHLRFGNHSRNSDVFLSRDASLHFYFTETIYAYIFLGIVPHSSMPNLIPDETLPETCFSRAH